MKILNIEIDYDFGNEDNAKKFEDAFIIAEKEINQITKKDLSNYEMIHNFRLVTEKVFDSVFGKEKRQEIFKDSKDFKKYVEAYKDLVKARKQYIKELNEMFDYFNKELDVVSERYSERDIK